MLQFGLRRHAQLSTEDADSCTQMDADLISHRVIRVMVSHCFAALYDNHVNTVPDHSVANAAMFGMRLIRETVGTFRGESRECRTSSHLSALSCRQDGWF